MDYITITGLKFSACHGCLAFEQTTPQDFIIDARLCLDLAPAGRSDDLGQTINYAAVCDDIKAIVCGLPKNLIEALAEAIADKLLTNYPLRQVRITVHKPQAPLEENFTDVSVTIERSRE